MRFWVVSRRVRLRLTAYGTLVLIGILSMTAASLVQQRFSLVQAATPGHESTQAAVDAAR